MAATIVYMRTTLQHLHTVLTVSLRTAAEKAKSYEIHIYNDDTYSKELLCRTYSPPHNIDNIVNEIKLALLSRDIQ